MKGEVSRHTFVIAHRAALSVVHPHYALVLFPSPSPQSTRPHALIPLAPHLLLIVPRLTPRTPLPPILVELLTIDDPPPLLRRRRPLPALALAFAIGRRPTPAATPPRRWRSIRGVVKRAVKVGGGRDRPRDEAFVLDEDDVAVVGLAEKVA